MERSTQEHQGRRPVSAALALLALGLVGVASLALAPLESLLPKGVDLPRAVLLIQPAILMVAGTFLGWWLAPRAGIDLPLIGGLVARTPVRPVIARLLPSAVIAGVLSALTLLAYGWLSAAEFAEQAGNIDLPLATRAFYGGVAEEIMIRWALMPLFILVAARLGSRPSVAFWTGNLIAALAFGLGHFTTLFAIMPDPPLWIMAAVLLGNLLPALMFGWLARYRGLEAAMLAHALTHLLAAGAGWLFA